MATESWVVTGPQVIEIDDVRDLRVRVIGGRVDVIVHEDPTRTDVRLEVHSLTGQPLEVTYNDGSLWAGVRASDGLPGVLGRWFGGRFHDRVDLNLVVPQQVAASLSTVDADVTLAGVQQDAQVETVSGQVVVDGTRGALRTRTVSGEVQVRGHIGDLTAGTVSGAVTAAGTLNRVTVNTVSGAVTLDGQAGSAIYQARTTSSPVTVRLPAGVGLNVDACSVTGRVVVDGVQQGTRGPASVKVDLRTPGATCFISTQTVSGALTVLRAAPASEAGATPQGV